MKRMSGGAKRERARPPRFGAPEEEGEEGEPAEPKEEANFALSGAQ